MFKITEFSTLTGLTIRTLQYYDEIGLLVPQREDNDHRMYTYKDLIISNEIMLLKNMGFSLHEIKKQIKTNQQVDLKKSLARQKKILQKKQQEIDKQIANINWLIEVENNNKILEESAIKRVFLDNNPLKEQLSSILNFDFEDSKSVNYLKQYEGTIDFDTFFKSISKLQEYHVYEKCVQVEIAQFVEYLQESYQDSFSIDNLPQFAFLYIDNEEAKNHLKQYGEHFNQFLVDALIYFSQNQVQEVKNRK